MSQSPNIIICSNVHPSKINPNGKVIRLSYFDNEKEKGNVRIALSRFIKNPDELPERIVDLLEIASYVFSADRAVDRGERDSLYNESWTRIFEFHIPVRDLAFWEQDNVKTALSNALVFMSGDRKYNFYFYQMNQENQPNESNYTQLSLFTKDFLPISDASNTEIILFSGGLDSLAGALDFLHTFPEKKLCLVSHQANKKVTHTQDVLVELLMKKFPNRINHYKYECHLRKFSSLEETQRTRMFLYASIAFSICNYYDKHSFNVYENGITSINLPKQGDIMNARASRTTHPKTIGLMQAFLQCFDNTFTIKNPFIMKTKKDIVNIFKETDELNMIENAVSCSTTRNKPGGASHCGCCSQCIDRRFAMFSAELEAYDEGVYKEDFINHIPDSETKQRLYGTLRLACMEGIRNQADFRVKFLNELDDLIDYIPGDNPDDKLSDVYDLFCRYGDSILYAAKRMQMKYEDLSSQIPKDSLLEMLASRAYKKTPIEHKVIEIDNILKKTIPILFKREEPKNENDLNDKVQAILISESTKFEREYPPIRFGITTYNPDHSQDDLLIETKFIRKNTTPSVATSGIAEDMTKVPKAYGLLFIVYDPERQIDDDDTFIRDFENRREGCYVRIYR
ncbi:MAG: hypothetical protein PWQ60_609 [Thermoanaerobacteraceae bacterium]|jgi:hypothetical protein|nr:hypothetical protein [Thermoanaerobacteraceae bacterium]